MGSSDNIKNRCGERRQRLPNESCTNHGGSGRIGEKKESKLTQKGSTEAMALGRDQL